MQKKVLIVYSSGGMGHVTAARAIEEAFKQYHPQVVVRNVDIMVFAYAWFRHFLVDGYNYLSDHFPRGWGFLYRIFNKPSRHGVLDGVGNLAIARRFLKAVVDFKPDFIINTHPLPSRLVAESKRHDLIAITSSIVVTDFGCHSFWVDRGTNYYFTATAVVGQCLSQYGVKPEQVVVSGIPIERKFSQPVTASVVRQTLGLPTGAPTVLMVGGQFTFEQLKAMVGGIRAAVPTVVFLIVAGRDKKLKQALDRSPLGHDAQVKTFGFIDNLHELMSVADLIFSKAGGLTVSECMAKGLPMVINKVIPGQEEDNVTYLVKTGAAVKANSVEEIIKTVALLLREPARLAAMRSACQKIGRPEAAQRVADFVYQQIASRRQ